MTLTNSGKFNSAIDDLSHRALKAKFKIRQLMSSVNVIPVRTFLKLFDAVIQPILLYGSEIWGPEVLNIEYLNLNSKIEKTQIKYLKSILQVNSKTTNIAVLLELGRFPLQYQIAMAMIKYWVKVISSPENSLIREAYQMERESANTHHNWVSSIHSLLTKFGFEEVLRNHQIDQIHIADISLKIKDHFAQKINETLFNDNRQGNMKNKLRSYRLFKKELNYESYIDIIKNPYMRASLTQFRLSAHQLNIETGRHHKMALEKRICKCCKTNEIEDEMHFLFNCPLYEMERKDILNMDVKQHKLQESFIEIMKRPIY